MVPSSNIWWPFAPSERGISQSITGVIAPEFNNFNNSLKSECEPIVDPKIDNCFEKTCRISVSAIGPFVFPTVTILPPIPDNRIDFEEFVYGNNSNLLWDENDDEILKLHRRNPNH